MDDLFAPAQAVASLEDCHFYHSIELPDHDPIKGEWDLRSGVDAYLGHASFAGARVLDVGTATGFLTFHMERLGADVVSCDLSQQESWDVVPYAELDTDAFVAARKAHAHRLNNSYWYCHRVLESTARLLHASVYALPPALGSMDAAVLGCVLLHLRDPFRALEAVAVHTDETMVVTEQVPATPDEILFRPDPVTREPRETWWQLSPSIVQRFLHILGFGASVVTYHTQTGPAGPEPMFTVVGRRTQRRPPLVRR